MKNQKKLFCRKKLNNKFYYIQFFESIDNKKRYVVKYRKVNERCLSNFTTKAN